VCVTPNSRRAYTATIRSVHRASSVSSEVASARGEEFWKPGLGTFVRSLAVVSWSFGDVTDPPNARAQREPRSVVAWCYASPCTPGPLANRS
jgi:hypothetical protein